MNPTTTKSIRKVINRGGGLNSFRAAATALCAAALAGSAVATTVNDGETIAWFPLDADLLSVVNAGDNPASMPTYIPEGGSIAYVAYDAPHPIVDASGNVTRESKFVRMDKSRVYIPLSNFDLGSDVSSITFETFICGDGRSSVNEVAAWDEVIWLDEPNGTNEQGKYPRNSSHRAFYFQDSNDAAGKAYFKIGSNKSNDSQIWFDGVWHHVAVTINGTAVTLFKDYAKVADLTLDTAWSGSSSLYLVLGSRSGGSTLDFDEIRITKGVLAPTQFLCFGVRPVPQDGDTMLYMPFDGNMASIAGDHYETFMGFVLTGTPAYEANVWKERIVEYGNQDAVVRRENTRSLKADKAAVTKTIRNPHLLTNVFNSATIEFFIKGPEDSADVTEWNEILFFGKGYGAAANKDRFGLLVQAQADKKYYLRADTDTVSASATTTFPIADGKWHHFAVSVEPGENTTTFRFYVDYGEPVTQTINGSWAGLRFGSKLLSFGASGSVLWFDEFRVTKGVLPKAKFLKAKAAEGTAIVFR